MLERQLGQHVHIRGVACLGLLDSGELQFIKKDFSQRLGGVDIEDLSGQTVDSFDLLLKLNFDLL